MKTASALAALLCVAFTAAAKAADPHAGYFYPAGIQAGTTNRILVGGQNMWRLRGMHFGTKGLRVLDIEPVPGFPNPTGMQMRHLKNWLDGIAKGNREEPEKPDDPHMSEWRSNSWWRVLGTLDRFEKFSGRNGVLVGDLVQLVNYGRQFTRLHAELLNNRKQAIGRFRRV